MARNPQRLPYPIWWEAQAIGEIRYADNYSSIQAAITSLPATGGTVFIPEGTYTLTSALVLPSNVVLCGSGGATILRCANNTDINIIYAIDKTNITIKDLTLDGNKANNATAGDRELQNGIYLKDVCTDVLIEGLFIKDTIRSGIKLGQTQIEYNQCQRVIIDNCIILDCGVAEGSDVEGIMGKGCVEITVSNCIIKRAYRHGINFYGSKHLIITGNVSSDAVLNDGICFYNCEYGTITGNIAKDNPHLGIVINTSTVGEDIQDGPCKKIVIADNVVEGGDSYGITSYFDATAIATYIIIKGNTVENAGGHGILVLYNNDVIINNNVIENSTDSGIQVEYSENIVVSGNTMTTGTYGINIVNSTIRVSVVGNVVHGNSAKGINCNYLSDFAISGNVVYDNDSDGIFMEGCVEGTITGNSCNDSSTGDGIQLHNSTDVVVSGNQCTDNAGQGVNETGTTDFTLLDGCNLRGNIGANHTVDAANSVVGDVI